MSQTARDLERLRDIDACAELLSRQFQRELRAAFDAGFAASQSGSCPDLAFAAVRDRLLGGGA